MSENIHLSTNAPQALPANTILKGQYLAEACIGSGGFGITYRAKNLKVENDAVAIKEYFPRAVVERGERGRVRVRPGSADEYARWQENYEREYSLLAKLRGNRAIINVRETFRENDTSYLVMDFIPGETLEARVRNSGVLGGEAVMELMYGFLPEIAKMHHAGILHRDINPGNIMLPPGDMPKLIDFGSARLVPRNGGRLTSLLRPGFAPPEQYSDLSKQGPESDVYGLCASLYFALTGVIPPDGRLRLVKDELIPLSQLCAGPESLVRAIAHGLNPIQEKRPASFEALWQEIFQGATRQAPKKTVRSESEIEHIQPIPVKDGVAPPSPAGVYMAPRIRAAQRAARLLRPFNTRKYDAVLTSLERMANQALYTAADRVALEDSIFTLGRLFWLLTAILTRKDA